MSDESTRSRVGPEGWVLVLVTGETALTFPLPEAEGEGQTEKEGKALTFGRGAECDVVLDDQSVSRTHARLYGGRDVHIEDLGSRNGTRIRGVAIAPHTRIRLRAGDVIECGDAILFVRASRGDEGRTRDDHAAPSLVVGPEARWFEREGAQRIELGRRGALRLILARLVEARVAGTTRGLTVDEVFAAGWPGEHIHPGSASARVYTAIQRLRGLGLEGLLLTRDDGYLLDPQADVRWA